MEEYLEPLIDYEITIFKSYYTIILLRMNQETALQEIIKEFRSLLTKITLHTLMKQVLLKTNYALSDLEK